MVVKVMTIWLQLHQCLQFHRYQNLEGVNHFERLRRWMVHELKEYHNRKYCNFVSKKHRKLRCFEVGDLRDALWRRAITYRGTPRDYVTYKQTAYIVHGWWEMTTKTEGMLDNGGLRNMADHQTISLPSAQNHLTSPAWFCSLRCRPGNGTE